MSRRVLPDQRARERARTEHGRPLAVEAGAGTGKTRLLVGRVLDGLATGTVRIGSLVVITFTRKAAAELRSRVRRGIADLLATATGDERLRLLEAQRELPVAQISTVHAFCARLLREQAIAAGLDPGFSAPDDGDPDAPFDELWEEWLADVLADEERAAPIRDLVAWGGTLDALGEFARKAVENPDCELPPAVPPADFDAFWRSVASRVATDRRDLERLRHRPDRFAEALERTEAQLQRLERLPVEARIRWLSGRVGSDGLRFPRLAFNYGAPSAYRDPDAFQTTKQALKSWCEDQLPSALACLFEPVAAAAAPLVAEFREWARQARRDRNTLGFTDQLFEVRELLRDPVAAARAREGIRELLVDEFQDTDPLMSDIFDALCAGPGGISLFIVGDPKQSIYRFRRADVHTYMEKVRTLSEGGGLESIVVNFRSTAPLLSTVNQVAGEIFASQRWAQQAGWQRLEADPDAAAARGPALVLVPAAADRANPPAEERAAFEADALAQELRAASLAGFRWRRMAVLFPKGTRAHVLEDALDRHGIPYRQEKSKRFFRRPEIGEIAHVLAAVADPWEPLFAVAALRTRLLGVPDALLARHAAAGGTFVPADGCERGEADVREALGRLAEWHARSSRTAPPDLLRDILDETGYLLLLASRPDRARESANVDRVLDRARSRWASGCVDLSDLAAWLRNSVLTEDPNETESPAAADDDRVALLTIHGAKGLEWDVVGLFELGAQQRKGSDSALVSRGARQVEASFSKLLRTPGYEAAEDEDAMLEDAERARLVYVALTRARHRLILPCPRVARAEGLRETLELSPTFAGWQNAAFEGRHPDEGTVECHPLAATVADASGPVTVVPCNDAPGLGRAITADVWGVRRNELLDAADRGVVITPSGLHRFYEPIPGVPLPADGKEIGSAVHRSMEWLASGVCAIDETERAVARAAEEESLGAGATARVLEFVRRAESADVFQRARRAAWSASELPFAWTAPFDALGADACGLVGSALRDVGRNVPEATDPITVEGVADLVFRENDSLVVVDYKTDPWLEPAHLDLLVERYASQIHLYASALSACTGLAVAETWLLFLGGPRCAPRLVQR